MTEHDEVYGQDRAEALEALLRSIARRIGELDRRDALLAHAPELLRMLGEARSELFHYEVRVTYDTPEVAEHRRLVEEATRPPEFDPSHDSHDEDDDVWRGPSRP